MIRIFVKIFSLLIFTALVTPLAFAEDNFKQIQLTEEHINNYIKANSDLQNVFEKIEKAGDEPDEKLISELESVASRYKFKSFDELDAVAQTISFIMTGFDFDSGSFMEPKKAMQEEIVALKDDKSMPEEERKELLKELEEAVKAAPDVEFKSNIDLVRKYLSKLGQLN